MGLKRRKALLFRPSMRWERPVEDFVKEKLQGLTLAAPCGKSPLGSVKVDLDRGNNPDIIADIEHLPFRRHVFDGAVSDPIWKVKLFHRMNYWFELMNVVKAGGLIILNATWIPYTRRADPLELWTRQSVDFSNASTIQVWRNLSLYDQVESKEQAAKRGDEQPPLEERLPAPAAPGQGGSEP